MKTIIGTKADVAKELTAQVAAVLASKPEANIAISAVDLPAEVLDALAASDIAFDRAALSAEGAPLRGEVADCDALSQPLPDGNHGENLNEAQA